jgi:mycothiol synthase
MGKNFIIRPYSDSDAGGIASFFAESAQLDTSIKPISEESWRYFATRHFNNGAKDFAVAESDRKIVGVLTSMISADLTDGPARHFRIIVHPNYRRNGIGTKLLELAESQDSKPITIQCNSLGKWIEGNIFLKNKGFTMVHTDYLMRFSSGLIPDTPPVEGVILRPYRASDNNRWSELSNDAYRNSPNFDKTTSDSVNNDAQAAGFHLWVAEQEEEMVGFCHSIADTEFGLINSVVVLPELRRKGIGKILMIAAMRTLIGQGSIEIQLNVDSENIPAIHLYQSLGFQQYDSMILYRRSQ